MPIWLDALIRTIFPKDKFLCEVCQRNKSIGLFTRVWEDGEKDVNLHLCESCSISDSDGMYRIFRTS